MPLPPYAKLRRLSAGAEPLSVVEAKAYCRVETADEDALFPDLIAAARRQCEQWTNRSLVASTYRLTLDGFATSAHPILSAWAVGSCPWIGDDAIELPMGPLIAVTAVGYLGMDNALHALDPATLDVSPGTPGRVAPRFGGYFPFALPQIASVTIDYTAGIDPDDLAVVKTAMRLLVAREYAVRLPGAREVGDDRIRAVLAPITYHGYG